MTVIPSATVSTLDIRYQSGFFDGEGCVHITHERLPMVTISIVQKNPEVLWAFREYWGFGSIGQDKNAIWRWTVAGSGNCLEMLSAMHPYLIVKRDVAEIAIQLLERIIAKAGRAYDRGGSLTSEEIDIRMALASEARQLNSRTRTRSI